MKGSQETELERKLPPSGEGQGGRTMKSHAAVTLVALLAVESLTLSVNVNTPAGAPTVPLISPVEEFSMRPAGSAPLAIA